MSDCNSTPACAPEQLLGLRLQQAINIDPKPEDANTNVNAPSNPGYLTSTEGLRIETEVLCTHMPTIPYITTITLILNLNLENSHRNKRGAVNPLEARCGTSSHRIRIEIEELNDEPI